MRCVGGLARAALVAVVALACIALAHADDAADLDDMLDVLENELEHVLLSPDDLARAVHGNRTEQLRWSQAGHVARFLGLQPIRRLVLPTRVNVILMGFDDSSSLGALQAAAWLRHVDHLLPHLLASETADHAAAGESDDADDFFAHVPKPRQADASSLVWFSVHMAVIELPASAARFFAALRNSFIRPDTPSSEHAIDAFAVESVLSDMLADLGLVSDPSIVLSNVPSPLPESHRIGYRYGLSERELGQLEGNLDPTAFAAFAASGDSQQQKAARASSVPDFVPRPRRPPINASLTRDRLDEAEFDAWCAHYLAKRGWQMANAASMPKQHYFHNVLAAEQLGTLPVLMSAADAPPSLRFEAGSYGETGLVAVLRRMIDSNSTGARRDALGMVRSLDAPTETALTDLWLAEARWALVDLSAGPFSWGPSLGGTGLRAVSSVPRLAGGEAARADDWALLPSPQQIDSATSEAVLRAYAERVCDFDANAHESPLCAQIRARLLFLAERRTAREGAVLQPQPREVLVLGGDSDENDAAVAASPLSEASFVRDRFFAGLGAVLDTALHSFVLPTGVAVPKVSVLYQRIVFSIVVIADHASFNPLAADGLDVELVKAELGKLRLAEQEFVFSVQSRALGDDPALGVAVASSLRSMRSPHARADRGMAPHDSQYICTRTLVRQMLSLGTVPNLPYVGAVSSRTLNVPVVLLSLDRTMPVWLDRQHRVRLRQGVLVASQSPLREWQSDFTANGAPLLQNLRDVTGPVLAGLQQLLGGTFALHEGFSRELGRMEHQWLWSVGRSPLASATYGSALSQFTIDAHRRNTLAALLVTALDAYNGAVARLAAARTDVNNIHVLHESSRATDLLRSAAELRPRLARVQAALAEGADGERALRLGWELELEMQNVRIHSIGLAHEVDRYYCSAADHTHVASAAPASLMPSAGTSSRWTLYAILGLVNASLIGTYLFVRYRAGVGGRGAAASLKLKVN